MQINEWSLIIFTTIMQMAVGSFVILGGVHFFASRRYSEKDAELLSDRALLAIGPVVALALLVTLLHLGNPLNAPQAIGNLGSSWLSREIGLALVFSIGGAVFAFMQWRKIGSPSIRKALALAVAAVGLVLVYAMSQVYQLPTVPAWDSLATPVSFFLTAFLLGALAISAAFVAAYWYLGRKGSLAKSDIQFDILATTLRYIALLSLVLLGVQFVVIPLYLAQMAVNPSAAAGQSMAILLNQHGVWFGLRLVLLFVGAGLFALFVYLNATSEAKARIAGYLTLAAFVLVLASEIIGRFLFYSSMVRIGL
jgi:anaerobic dimethyl sulfoxide reductase subunit C (anchor subunit)